MQKPGISGWDNVADWYDRLLGEQGSDYHRNVIIPTAVRMLDVSAGQKILDLCCGQGVLVRALLAVGVRDVLGVDLSPRLVEAAERHSMRSESSVGGQRMGNTGGARGFGEKGRLGNKHRVAGRTQNLPPERPQEQSTQSSARAQFIVADAARGGPWADGSFDRAACVMAAHDLADLDGLCRTAAAALKPAGRFVMVLVHPCFRIPRQSSWGWDEQKRIQYRRIDRYANPLEIPITTHPGRRDSQETRFYHRPLSAYINALAAAGLGVIACEEPLSHRRAAPGGRSRGENRAAAEFPLFLGLAAVRMPR